MPFFYGRAVPDTEAFISGVEEMETMGQSSMRSRPL